MAKHKAWNIKVHAVLPDGAKLDENASFSAPSWMTVDEAMKFARDRLSKSSQRVRSINVAAPITDRKILAYVG